MFMKLGMYVVTAQIGETHGSRTALFVVVGDGLTKKINRTQCVILVVPSVFGSTLFKYSAWGLGVVLRWKEGMGCQDFFFWSTVPNLLFGGSQCFWLPFVQVFGMGAGCRFWGGCGGWVN